MLAGTKILMRLIDEGKLSFNEQDLKGRTASERKLLYTLGAYKNTPIPSYIQYHFGIRAAKTLINEHAVTEFSDRIVDYLVYLHDLNQDTIHNLVKIGFDIPSLVANASKRQWFIGDLHKTLKTYEGIVKGRDLFISGMGSFDIEAAQAYNTRYGSPQLLSLSEFRYSGYFDRVLDYNDSYHIKILNKLDAWKWVKDTGFPLERLDELMDAGVLGLWDKKRKLNSTIATLNNMVERDLKLTYADKESFNYPDNIVKQAGSFVMPETGIDLKRQAKRFSNCSGSYVNKIHKGECYIAYSDNVMVEFNGAGTIRQIHGPRNEQVSSSQQAAAIAAITTLLAQ